MPDIEANGLGPDVRSGISIEVTYDEREKMYTASSPGFEFLKITSDDEAYARREMKRLIRAELRRQERNAKRT